jgi:hypothetical protein
MIQDLCTVVRVSARGGGCVKTQAFKVPLVIRGSEEAKRILIAALLADDERKKDLTHIERHAILCSLTTAPARLGR